MAEQIVCSCGTVNDAGAKYCKNCNAPFGTEWKKEKHEFAVFIPAENYRKGNKDAVIIPFGSKGLIFENGQLVENVESGKYSLTQENFLTRLFNPEKLYSVFIMNAGLVSLGFDFKKIFTKDDVPVELSLEIEFNCENPALFFMNLMKNNVSFEIDDFRPVFFKAIKNILDSNFKNYNFDQLDTGIEFKSKICAYLESELRVLCRSNGLNLNLVKSFSFVQETLERLKDREVEVKFGYEEEKIKRDETDLTVEQISGDIHKTREVGRKKVEHDLARADLLNKRIQVLKKLQEADTEEIKTKEDFRKFKQEIDREKVLDEAEWTEFERELLWKDEDQVRDRQFLTDKIEIQQAHDIARLKLLEDNKLSLEEKKARFEVLDLELKNELKLEFEKIDGLAKIKNAELQAALQQDKIERLGKKQTDIEIAMEEMELKKKQFANDIEQDKERGQAELELKKVELEYDQLEFEFAMTVREKKDSQDLKKQAELDALDAKRKNDALEIKLREEQAAHDREISMMREVAGIERDKMKALSGLSTEQLISVSDGDSAQILGGLAQTQALKGLSADEIMAMKNPEAFRDALVERAKQSSADKEKILYERIITMMESNNRTMAQAQRENAARTDRIVDRLQDVAVEGMRATSGQRRDMDQAQKEASNHKDQIYERSMDRLSGVEHVRAGAGNQQDKQVIVCRNCRHEVDANANNCDNCGEKLY